MRKSFVAFVCGAIVFVLFLSPICNSVAQAKGNYTPRIESLNENSLNDEIADIEQASAFRVLNLLEEMPDSVAESGIEAGVEWLNANKGSDFSGQKFVAKGEYLDLVEYPNVIKPASVGGCIWGITKAIAMNALPWSKIVKIKKAVKIMGGTRVVANTVIKAYKHQRNLGYGRTKAIKRAIDVTKRAVPREYVKHWVEFFSLGVVKKECF